MKRLSVVTLVLLLAFNLLACTPQSETPAETTAAQTEAATTEAGSSSAPAKADVGNQNNYPLEIRNYNSQQQYLYETFEKAPERVVVKNRETLEILLELGLGDRVVLTEKVDPEKILPKYREEYKKLKTVDDIYTAKEQMLAAEPDLVIGWYSAFMKEDRGTTEFWHERGVNTFIQRNTGGELTRQMDNVYYDILDLGKIFNCRDKAEALVLKMQGEVHDITEKIVAVNKAKFDTYDSKPGLAVIEVADGEYRLYGQKALAHDMMVALGIKDVTSGYGYGYNDEHLIQRDPDVLLVVFFSSQSEQEVIDKVYNNPALANLKAVKNKRVHGIILDEMYGGGMRTIEGYKTMAKAVYPEIFE